MTLLPSSATATALAAINLIGATAGSINAQEVDIIKKGKRLHLDDIKIKQFDTNSAPSIVKQQPTAAMKPDVGILSKDLSRNKGREQPVDQQFAIHRKKQATVDVDVGILSNGRRMQIYTLRMKSQGDHYRVRRSFPSCVQLKMVVLGG